MLDDVWGSMSNQGTKTGTQQIKFDELNDFVILHIFFHIYMKVVSFK